MAIGIRANGFTSYDTTVAGAAGGVLVTIPAGCTTGDLMIVVMSVNVNFPGSSVSITNISGWTPIVSNITVSNSDTEITSVFYRIYQSGDSSWHFAYTNGGSGNAVGICFQTFTGCDTTTPIDVTGTAVTSTTSPVTAGSITIVTANSCELIAGGSSPGSPSGASASGFNEDDNNGLRQQAYLLNKLTPLSTGATSTVTVAANSNVSMAIIPFALRPISSVVTHSINANLTAQIDLGSGFGVKSSLANSLNTYGTITIGPGVLLRTLLSFTDQHDIVFRPGVTSRILAGLTAQVDLSLAAGRKSPLVVALTQNDDILLTQGIISRLSQNFTAQVDIALSPGRISQQNLPLTAQVDLNFLAGRKTPLTVTLTQNDDIQLAAGRISQINASLTQNDDLFINIIRNSPLFATLSAQTDITFSTVRFSPINAGLTAQNDILLVYGRISSIGLSYDVHADLFQNLILNAQIQPEFANFTASNDINLRLVRLTQSSQTYVTQADFGLMGVRAVTTPLSLDVHGDIILQGITFRYLSQAFVANFDLNVQAGNKSAIQAGLIAQADLLFLPVNKSPVNLPFQVFADLGLNLIKSTPGLVTNLNMDARVDFILNGIKLTQLMQQFAAQADFSSRLIHLMTLQIPLTAQVDLQATPVRLTQSTAAMTAQGDLGFTLVHGIPIYVAVDTHVDFAALSQRYLVGQPVFVAEADFTFHGLSRNALNVALDAAGTLTILLQEKQIGSVTEIVNMILQVVNAVNFPVQSVQSVNLIVHDLRSVIFPVS